MPRLRTYLARRFRDARHALLGCRTVDRKALAATFLSGSGIEIGALHQPLRLPSHARVRYVDRMPVAELRRHYPELADFHLVEVDILDDGERLQSQADASQDFIIANHFLEHCQDTLGTLSNLLRTLRPGGTLFITVPDKRYTFDVDRPVTTFDHLIRDFHEGPATSRHSHFLEWAHLVDKVPAGDALERRARELQERSYSIHFHVWTAAGVLELFHRLNDHIPQAIEVLAFFQGRHEVVVVARRTR